MPAIIEHKDDTSKNHQCGEMLSIGRVPPNNVQLDKDSRVSRNHAIIRHMGEDRYFLMDVGSSNGTFINGKKITVPTKLNPADEIKIGNTSFIFRHLTEPVGKDNLQDIDGTTMLSMGTSVKEVTLLVSDIRNYTRLSESISTDLLARVMGTWFAAATKIIENHKGVVDKFIGDAVMVRWINSHNTTRATVRASLQTTWDMSQALNDVTRQFPELPLPLRTGMGINTGEAAMGHLGSGGKREYTAMGDTVNLAFRLETASKELGKDVVLGPASYMCLPETVWKNHTTSILVKGKEEPVTVCSFTFAELQQILADIAG